MGYKYGFLILHYYQSKSGKNDWEIFYLGSDNMPLISVNLEREIEKEKIAHR